MLATYGSFALILAASCVIGQGLFVVCGARQWSWLAPAVGLGIVTAVAWGTVRLPGEGTASAIAIGVIALASLVCVVARTGPPDRGIAPGVAVAVVVALAASIPFFVEGRFGILGTGLNPDMSQHLFAADRLAHGDGGRLISQGYPLGPHALVVAASAVTGGGLVQGFDGLMLAIAVCAALAPMGLVNGLAPWRRVVSCALVALAYLVSSYLIQGAFKETMEALYVLAFAIGLHEVGRGTLVARPRAGPGRRPALAAVPLAALAVGSAYAYSWPGLLWLGGAAAAWATVELIVVARANSAGAALGLARAAAPIAVVAVAVVCIACAPGGRADGRFRELRDLQSLRPGAREPLQSDLAVGGARDLALRGLPTRPRRWRGARGRLLSGRAARAPGAGAWPRLVALAPRAGGPGRSRRGRRAVCATRTSRAPRTRPRSRSWSRRLWRC